jgi:hypothetical protein
MDEVKAINGALDNAMEPTLETIGVFGAMIVLYVDKPLSNFGIAGFQSVPPEEEEQARETISNWWNRLWNN